MSKSGGRIAIPTINLLLPFTILLLNGACAGGFADKPTLSSDQAIQEAEEINSICLETEEDLPWYEDDDVDKTLNELFSRLGTVVVHPGQDCEMTVILQISGRDQEDTLGVYYEDNVPVATEFFHREARTTGELTVTLNGYETILHKIENEGASKWDVDFYAEVLDHIAFFWGNEVYQHAIYLPALQEVAREKLIALGDAGVRILGQLYLEADSEVQYELWMAFQMLDPEEAVEVVPYSIEALGDGKKRLIEPENLLHMITGEDLGRDAQAWSEWWQNR